MERTFIGSTARNVEPMCLGRNYKEKKNCKMCLFLENCNKKTIIRANDKKKKTGSELPR